MNLITTIKYIKSLLKKKAKNTPFPQNGAEAIVIQEQNIDSSFTFSVGVGIIKSNESTSRYFDVQGRVFDDTMHKFYPSNLRIEPKQIATTKGLEYSCGVFEPGLIRAVDEADWSQKFATLDHLIEVLENLGKNDLGSLFDKFKS